MKPLVLLVLVLVLVRLVWTGTSRVALKDELLPYGADAHHGPRHSHRHVRDCQPVAHGNSTHEIWTGARLSGRPHSSTFVTDLIGTSGHVFGHMTTVLDPLGWVSVLEPGGPGGCVQARRVSVPQTSAGCVFAQNAGFFDTRTGSCLGNVVSDSRLVKDSRGVMNAQFGIREDGSLVFGYLSQQEVLDQLNPFVQLVSGVIWLLRDGEVYIQESLKAECDQTQETGDLRYFVDVVSARSAVAHDAAGRLILFQVDGQTGARGMNLWEVANFLKQNGAINAINLDGGGSSTFASAGSLASYPSDECKNDSRWRCARPVSTVLCVRPPQCQPRHDCSGNGDCLDGQCVCRGFWTGSTCDSLRCQQDCGARGVCTSGGCVCDPGWRGQNCTEVCPPSLYGDACSHTCVCVNGGVCDHVTGGCTCTPGYHGDACQEVCPPGLFGLSCAERCRCEDHCPCDHVTGSCNFTAQGVNDTLYTAGLCLARHMLSSWTRNREVEGQSHLTESSWLTLTVLLSLLLSISLMTHVRACRAGQGSSSSRRHNYMYVPLTDTSLKSHDPESQEEDLLPVAPTTLEPGDSPESRCNDQSPQGHVRR